MARRVLTIEEQIRGLRRAIASPRTPLHLRKSLEKRREELARKLEFRHRTRKRGAMQKRAPGLLDWLGL
jgi:hypothetical protein